jgi:uncharacterized membrane protein
MRGYNWRLGNQAAQRRALFDIMVVRCRHPEETVVRVLARGNFSLGAGGLLNLLLALGAVTLLLAGLLAWQGFWPVLLIAVVQIVLVSWILIRAWERAWVVETIDVGPDRIDITQQRHKRRRQSELQTAWTVVEVRKPEIAWYGPKVCLRSGADVIELGDFLTSEEKMRLANFLERAIAKHSALKGADRI